MKAEGEEQSEKTGSHSQEGEWEVEEAAAVRLRLSGWGFWIEGFRKATKVDGHTILMSGFRCCYWIFFFLLVFKHVIHMCSYVRRKCYFVR